MAKQSEQGASTCVLVLVAIFAVLLAVAFFGMVTLPIFLLIGHIYYDYKCKKWIPKLSGTMNDFWLNSEEKRLFREASRTAHALASHTEEMKRRGIEAGISVNKDGAFSARSNLGKQIRETLEKNTPKIESSLKRMNFLSRQPRERWDALNAAVVRAKCMPAAFVFWIFTYIGYCWLFLKYSFSEMFTYYFASITNSFVGAESETPIPSGYTPALLIACIVAVIIYAIMAVGLSKEGAKHSPIPDKVTMQNLNDFEQGGSTSMQDANMDKVPETIVAAPEPPRSEPPELSDESTEKARKLVISMMALAKDIETSLRLNGVEFTEPLEEQVRGDLCVFVLYLCASDGVMSPEEERFLHNSLNMKYADRLERDDFIKKIHANKDVFVKDAPSSFHSFVRYDNARLISGSEPSDESVSEQLFLAYQHIGNELLACDGALNSEVEDMTRYLAMIDAFIKTNLNKYTVRPKRRRRTKAEMQAARAAEAEQSEQEKNQQDADGLLSELSALVGLDQVKQDVKSLINLLRIRSIRAERGIRQPDMSLHLVFTGNPGTGKTTVARLLAKIYQQIGLLEKGHLVEVDRSKLVAGYVGQTAIQTQKMINEAMGGILFIDEAYTLTAAKSQNDFGQEAVDTLLKGMEDNRGRFIVIVAGYSEPMEKFLASNPGLRSRFNKQIFFADYTPDELFCIFTSLCDNNGLTLALDAAAHAEQYFKEKYAQRDSTFANGRDVRNYFERILVNQADRLSGLDKVNDEDLSCIKISDL